MDESTAVETVGDAPRPYWQSDPCPAWCDEQHADDDRPEDRRHVGGTDAMPLTLHGPRTYRTGPGRNDISVRPRMLIFDIEQGWRESEPKISLSDDDAVLLQLTPTEARAVIARLEALLDGEVDS